MEGQTDQEDTDRLQNQFQCDDQGDQIFTTVKDEGQNCNCDQDKGQINTESDHSVGVCRLSSNESERRLGLDSTQRNNTDQCDPKSKTDQDKRDWISQINHVAESMYIGEGDKGGCPGRIEIRDQGTVRSAMASKATENQEGQDQRDDTQGQSSIGCRVSIRLSQVDMYWDHHNYKLEQDGNSPYIYYDKGLSQKIEIKQSIHKRTGQIHYNQHDKSINWAKRTDYKQTTHQSDKPQKKVQGRDHKRKKQESKQIKRIKRLQNTEVG